MYLFADFGTLPLGVVAIAAQRAGVARPLERMAGAIRSVFQPRRTARRLPSLSARVAERQSAQVDERDARACHRSRHVSIVAAFHHSCSLERRACLAAVAGGAPRAHWRADSGRHELPEAGSALGGGARQYCGTLGKVANCQVAVTAALWTGVRAWMLGAALYVPAEWLTPEARERTQIPASLRFHEKWRLALTLLRQIRAAGFQITAVLGDAEFGDNGMLRQYLAPRWTPVRARDFVASDRVPRRRPASAVAVRAIGEQLLCRGPRGASSGGAMGGIDRGKPSSRRCGSRPPTAGRTGAAPRTSGSCANGISAGRRASSTTSSHCRPPRRATPWCGWPSAVGNRATVPGAQRRTRLDHFEGRSFVGWHRHAVLTAMAYSWLQDARRRAGARLPTLPVARAVITEILTAHFFVTRPRYLRTMQKLAEIDLRI